jgi:stage II sporulation protein R
MRKFTLRKLLVVGSLALFITVGWLMLFIADRQSTVVASKPSGLIRLHILANSDSQADQQLKLQVRDAVVKYLTPHLAGLESSADAHNFIVNNQGEISQVAKSVIANNGMNYPVNLQIGIFDFPIKAYGNLVLPAGKYEAVRILIGNGEGKNWWCVLFPPLCFVDGTNAIAVSTESITPGMAKPGSGTVEFRSRLLEWMESLSKNVPNK